MSHILVFLLATTSFALIVYSFIPDQGAIIAIRSRKEKTKEFDVVSQQLLDINLLAEEREPVRGMVHVHRALEHLIEHRDGLVGLAGLAAR